MATKKTKPNVIIGIACQGVVKSRMAQSVACNIIKANGVVSDVLMKETCDVVSSRTWLVREAIKKGATHLLFVDSDMFFPAEALNTLLSHDKDIIGVKYNKRQFPLEETHQPLIEEPDPKTGLLRCLSIGTGLMLIKLSIFEKMTEPWFSFGRGVEGQLTLGEDVWFCRNSQDSGYEVWCDPTIKVGHIGSFVY
jgi:hypothetical protein